VASVFTDDLVSLLLAALLFGALFLLLKGLERA
jgi:hypothetical protein